jgi:carboxylesterase
VSILPGAEPLSHDGTDVGVLMCHDLTRCPQSIRPCPQALAEAGYTVRLPLAFVERATGSMGGA